MSKVKVVFWSGTGNTAAMAQAVVDGVVAAGKDAELLEVSSVSPADLKDDAVFALGCPSMGAEQLEESEMEPFMEGLGSELSGKKVGLFGSFGWGAGEWMRDWEARVQADGGEVVNGEGVICNGEPDDEAIDALKSLGEALAANL
ncbi:MAG: flavodoxin [Lachnospiraceae bacterium]|nr:flavodoxin [Lachnospiraceae bacterium]